MHGCECLFMYVCERARVCVCLSVWGGGGGEERCLIS